MKKCQSCGYNNTDIMNYCMECGNALANQPQMVIPLDSLSGQNAEKTSEQVTENYENETVVKNNLAASQSIPTFQQQQPVPQKSNFKIYLAIGGGLFAVFALFGVFMAGIFFYTLQKQEQKPLRPIATETPLKEDSNPYPDETYPEPEETPIVKTSQESTEETITFPTPKTPTKSGKYEVKTLSGWQLSNIKTVGSQNFSVRASGRIKLDGIKKRVGIKGINGYKNRRVFKQFKTGALLMRTHYPDGKHSQIQPVGAGAFWVNDPNETGKIEFLINDNLSDANSGSFRVKVKDLGTQQN